MKIIVRVLVCALVSTLTGVEGYASQLSSSLQSQVEAAATSSSTIRSIKIDFSKGLDPRLWLHIPQAGVTATLLTAPPSRLRIEIPAEGIFDHWHHADAAPQLRIKPKWNNWTFSTRLKVEFPSSQERATAGVFVLFSERDMLYWSLHEDSHLRAARSTGLHELVVARAPSRDLELRITKNGDQYSFFHRAVGELEWSKAGIFLANETPRYVGVFGKTWAPRRLVFEASQLRLEEFDPESSTNSYVHILQ